MLGEKYISAIPEDEYNTICDSRDSTYKPKYDIKTIKNEKICQEALDIISFFYVRYWDNYGDDIIKILPEN